MLLFLVRKTLILLSTLLAIITLTFIMMKLVPGDPFIQEKALSAEVEQALRAQHGLDDPLYIQYFRYLSSIFSWKLGPSLIYKGRTAESIIRESFPVSALLAAEALCIAIGTGLFLGTLSALKQRSWVDSGAMLVAVCGVSVPNFVLATLLQYLLALKFELLPVARWGTFAQSILPAISLAALPTAFVARLTRSSLLEVFAQDYIKTAYAKGLHPTRVLFFHALRNGILPVFTYCSQLAVNILVGSFVIEKIFAIPGLGQWMVMAVSNRDYTVIMGTTVLYSSLLLGGMFLMDLVYTWIDPRLYIMGNKGGRS